MSLQEKYLIFAYDTLILGMPDCVSFLKNQTFRFPARLCGPYALLYGGNCYLVEASWAKGCWGELWEIDELTLMKLDKKYGHPTKFSRKIVEVCQDDAKFEAFAYVYPFSMLCERNLKTKQIDCYRNMFSEKIRAMAPVPEEKPRCC